MYPRTIKSSVIEAAVPQLRVPQFSPRFFVWLHRETVQVLVQQERLIAAFDQLTKGGRFWKGSVLPIRAPRHAVFFW